MFQKQNIIMPWIYLFIASIFEIAWTFSLKYMDMKKIMAINFVRFFDDTKSILTLAPLLGYIVFGLVNIYCFSVAIKSIPTATALAVWMGMALIGVKIVDITVFKQPYHLSQFFYFFLILAGIVGLKSGA